MPRKYRAPSGIEPLETPPFWLSCFHCGRGNRIDLHDPSRFRIMHNDGCPALDLIASGKRTKYASRTIRTP